LTETLEDNVDSRAPGSPRLAKQRSSASKQEDLVALAQQILHGSALVTSDNSNIITPEGSHSPSLPTVNFTRLDNLRDTTWNSSTERSAEQNKNMTTAETQLTPVSFHETPPAESATSRFTAVNGRETTSSVVQPSAAGNGHRRRESEDRPQTQPRTTPPGQEKLTITTTSTQREDWQHPANADRQNNAAGHQYPQHTAYTETELSHKRKRSGSVDRQTAHTSSTSSYHSHGLPSSKPADSGLGTDSPDTPREASIRPRSHHAQRDPYGHESQVRYPPYNDETREGASGGGLWYSQQQQDTRTTTDAQQISHHISSEEQLREALQREAEGVDNQDGYAGTSAGDDDDRSVSYQGGYAPDRMPLQMNPDHKKRKRNFSNRTKTGCMTCRRRKKKCDETRPECKNLFHLLIVAG
jgi:hypothetical protein